MVRQDQGLGTGTRLCLDRHRQRRCVSGHVPWLLRWLELGRHGEMDYMAKHAVLRATPQGLLPGARSVISVRLPYWPDAADAQKVLADSALAYVSRYALGRDYHRTIRSACRNSPTACVTKLRRWRQPSPLPAVFSPIRHR
jgi:epoxyqueuosine reductase QueG